MNPQFSGGDCTHDNFKIRTSPAAGPIMDPERKLDWMRREMKRIQRADDTEGSASTSAFIIDQLNQ